MYFGLLIMKSVSFSPIVTEVDLCSSSNVTSTFSCWVQVLAPLCQKGLRYLSASIFVGFYSTSVLACVRAFVCIF